MAIHKLNDDEKESELKKYGDLVLATLDYYMANSLMKIATPEFNSDDHYKYLKTLAQEHFQKGRLTRLKQWFRDLTEMQIETGDLKFNQYLRDKTPYDIDIFKSYFDRIDKIIEKGKITSDHQFYDVNILVDQLSQAEPVNSEKIEILNKLLLDYEDKKSRQK